MMTQNSSQSRIIAMWLVLLAFLCCMMVPSISLAKQDMTIATEGDPDDGLDYSGGGSGNLDSGDNLSSPIPDYNFYDLPVFLSSSGQDFQINWKVFFDSQFGILIIYPSTEISPRRVPR